MRFLSLFRSREQEFNTISGYDDVKDIIRWALDPEDNYNLLPYWTSCKLQDTVLDEYNGP